MVTINNFLLDRGRAILLLVLILSILMFFSNRHFTSNSDFENVQFQSHYWEIPQKVTLDVFNGKIEIINEDASVKRSFYNTIIIDCFWAFFFLASIYIMSKSISESREVFTFLLTTCIITYIFDLMENMTYLFQIELLVAYIEYISWIKIILYTICICILLYYLIKRIIGNTKDLV